MTPLSIGLATELYSDASKCEIIRHTVDHPLLAEISRSLRSMVRSLAEEGEEPYWKQTLGPLRRLAFACCSTPLPFSTAADVLQIDWETLRRQEQYCRQLFPDFHEGLSSLIGQMLTLSGEHRSPYVGQLEQLSRDSGGLSLILRDIRMNAAVDKYLSSSPALKNIRVVSVQQLRGARLCDALVTIGPCSWFPEFVFSAPRAGAIHVLSYRWIRDGWKPGPVFLKSSNSASGTNTSGLVGTLPRMGGAPDAAEILARDLLPPVTNFIRQKIPSGAGDETVSARLCYLSGNRAVFIAADEGATSLVIDTSESATAVVRRVRVDDLYSGLFILLRTSGGGDYIAPLADRILGTSASKRRAEQAEWKERLVAVAKRQTSFASRRELASTVCKRLHALNTSYARPANVLYWMSAKCIRPRKSEDFQAILGFAGIGDRYKELWAAMGEIDRAHRRAGHLIRRMLLQRIAETALEPLERDGEMVFDLGDEDGGTLSAFQVTGMSPEEIDVSPEQIGVLLDGEA